MKSMKNWIYILMLLLGGISYACSGEEDLEPSNVKEDYFSVPADATDEVSVLRREFYDKWGVHLLFNDTLKHELVGVNAYGDEIWETETLGLDYSLTSISGNQTRCEYIKDFEKMKLIAQAVGTYLSYMSPEDYPYSIFVASSMGYDYYGKWRSVSFVSNWRCMAFAIEDGNNVLADIVIWMRTELLSKYVEELYDEDYTLFTPFRNVTNQYRGDYIVDYVEDWDRSSMEMLYEYGFLSYEADSYDPEDCYYDTFHWDQDVDRKDYCRLILEVPEEADFQALYGQYPLVVEKYHIMKGLIDKYIAYKYK